MKTCSKCGETKPLAEFSKNASKRDGLQSKCKACDAVSRAKRYADNPEKAKASSVKYYADNREAILASINRDARRIYGYNYNAANPDKRKSAKAKWQADNRETCRVYCHNYRALKRENGGALSKDIAERLFSLQKGKCACGCNQNLGDDYHVDHIMPVALGGANEDWNIQLLRKRCNQQKSAKHPIDFMKQKGFLL